MDDNNHNPNPNPNPNPLSFLTKGSQVEVSSGEDAWYVATVIHPPPPPTNHHPTTTNNHLVYLEYHNLLSGDDNSSTLLREYANISYLRPSPAPDKTPPNFRLNDVVEAFYKDAWWTGVVTDVVDRENFVVAFRNPPDEARFHCSKLRVHRKWVDGKWFQPQKQGTAGLLFTVGKKVEVSFEKESLRDCWVPATILKNSENDTFLVEYQQPGTGDEAILHKVTVDHLHIRPSPPHLRDKNFVFLEKVDAYYDYGWWSGVITKVLADNRYRVFFKHTKQVREFIYSKVRPHMEWKGGKWFNASQGDMDGNATDSLIDAQVEQTTPSIDKQSSVATLLMKRSDQKNLDSNDKSSPPSKKLQDEIMNDDLSENTNCPSVGQSEGFDSEIGKMTDQSLGEIENLSHRKKVSFKLADSSRKKIGNLNNTLKSLQASDNGSQGDSMKSSTKEAVGEKDIAVSQANTLQKQSTEESPNVSESDTQPPSVPLSPLSVAEKEGHEADAASVAPKRKRGRPPKLQALSTATSVTFTNQNGGVVPSPPSVVEGGQNKEVGLPASSVTKSLEENQGPLKELPGIQNAPLSNDKLPNENTEQDLDIPVGQETKKCLTKKGKRKTISVNAECPAQESQDASKVKKVGSLGKDSATRNPDTSVEKSLVTVSDERPLSAWFEGKRFPLPVHGSEGTVEQSLTTSSEDLPFVRNTSLWKAIESMEAFQTLPQKPHFRPLLKGVKESSREGLAIGTMVTFSTIVERTRSLRSDDPRSIIEDCLETLVELENNGFDVKVIRDRLTRLLLMKDRQEELVERSKGLFEKIKESKVQRKRDDDEIEEFERQKRELDEKLKQLLLKKEKKMSEIGAIEAMNEKIEQEMRGMGAEFDGLATAPF